VTAQAFAACVLAVMATHAGAQQPYPNRPVRVLVGVPPGGSTDLITRMFAEGLRDGLGQPTVVENRPGANTAVAADAVARSAPDGHALLVSTDALLSIALLTKLNFDAFKDFAPIGIIAVSRFVLAVHPSLPVKTLKEFIALAKARPGQLNYASSGNAGTSHFGLEKFKMLTGTNIVHIPYRGAGPAIVDAIAGQVQVSLWTPLAIAEHVKAAKLKPLAVTGPQRLQLLDVSTFAEAGLPGYDHTVWFAVYAPAATPRAIVDRLNAEIAKMVASPKIKERLDSNGVEPLLSTPEQVTALMRAATAEMAKLIKVANIKMD
jgi:tripartite-type tricarboxylate transporter receptor subunit TctC